jgi:hypothetical protein
MLEGFDLADQFSHVASHFGRQHLHGTYIEIGIDQESPPDIHPRGFIINSVDGTHPTARVRKQWEGHTPLHHLGKLLLLPDFVREAAVSADGENFNAQRLQFCIFNGNCR